MEPIPLVTMRSPQGEVREVRATPENLSPLMAAGWVQVPAPIEPQPTEQE